MGKVDVVLSALTPLIETYVSLAANIGAEV